MGFDYGEILDFLLKIEFSDFVNSMMRQDYWADSLNSFCFRRRHERIRRVDVSIYNIRTGGNNGFILYLDEFKAVMSEYMWICTEKELTRKEEYDRLFKKLTDFIEKEGDTCSSMCLPAP